MISAHSTRVGLNQDLFTSGENYAGITDALRWKSPRMPLAYNRNLVAKRLMTKLGQGVLCTWGLSITSTWSHAESMGLHRSVAVDEGCIHRDDPGALGFLAARCEGCMRGLLTQERVAVSANRF